VASWINPNETILLAMLAGLLAVDERAGWQSLLSNPVYIAVLVGLLLGEVRVAVATGVALELVWLSILPMRGSRRPDIVSGAVVGVGTSCLILRHTADPRELLVAAAGVFSGIVVGHLAGALNRGVGRVRGRSLARFEIPAGAGAGPLVRRLLAAQYLSLFSYFITAALVVAIALPVTVFLGDRSTGWANAPVVRGAGWWVQLLPAFGAAALVQNYWHRHLNRFLLLSAGLVLVVLWFR